MRLLSSPKRLKPLLLACKDEAPVTQIHALIITTGIFSTNSSSNGLVIASYARIGDITSARHLFDKLPHRGVDAWNSIIVAYSRRYYLTEVLILYHQMVNEGVKPDSSTFTVAIKASSSLKDLEVGERIWRRAVDFGYGCDVFVGSSVLNLYVKCGKIDEAKLVFDKMVKRDVVCWATMITGLVQNGKVLEAVDMFRRMRKEGIEGDGVLMLGLIQACANLGVSKLGLSVHGHVVRREMLMDDVILQTSLVDMNFLFGEVAAKKILDLNPDDLGIYALVSNFFSLARMWDRVSILRKIMKETGMKKVPGYSAVEVNGKHEAFLVEDKSHHHYEEILQMLDSLDNEMRVIRHVPDSSHDVEEEVI
ncbi:PENTATRICOPEPTIDE REPEAT-CONTAINING PROTEIN [Salix koriyanagi]|uniref:PENTATRICOPEPTIDE REPEAT-CONTAINING PROTEIN n=1 Tax=Salix koriyanagi TaxID=2511006 RepID=A0A9Q0YUX6_9ROSI|nr:PENTATRICOPEPTIDE REPEAT-CONTAINING PROTEIN [Salix koriyanagi]